MNWYSILIDLLIIAFIAVMGRHGVLRGKFFLHIFQQKGYKFNEYGRWLWNHWTSRVITHAHLLFMFIIAGLFFLMSRTITGSAAVVTISLFGFFWFGPFNYYRGQQKKPLVFTPRMIRLTIPFALFCLILPVMTVYVAFIEQQLWLEGPMSGEGMTLISADIYYLALGWVLADIMVPLWVFPAALLTWPIEKRIHAHFIKLAMQKLADMPDLKVIAITGSYGKTSTKFMMRDLLEERYAVCSTPESYNTPMGICKVINDNLEARHQVLILEMGARYEGNIDELCDIAEPDISVITNIGIAHLETFGSREAIARTKSTLITRLKPGGTAVLNGDDPRVRTMAGMRDDIEVLMAGLKQGDFTASDITYGPDGTRFVVHTPDGQQETFRMRLIGSHNVQNMLLAVGVGSLFGLRLKTMAVAARRIEPIEHRLELKKAGDIHIIDDAFNSNPVGARNAVEILSQFDTGRRIIITPGMIELGEMEEVKNREFGEAIGRAGLDQVILIGAERSRPIVEGIRQTGFDMEKVSVVASLEEANRIVRETVKAGDVVLYENDLPDSFNE
ncbi:MAG: UDP-N-acetylmuramoyl-tripeptide--D-alanyl-D-alanine ligase [Balneolaceae bacterium]|nr:UDP-N-acetylmuramoyl-tripeptide--D-alanyl-D-alanine ligase [Balneolaceae bacterium]